MLDAMQARERGILDEEADWFLNTATGKKMSLEDAVDAGLVAAQFDERPASHPTYETRTYAVGFVVDQVSRLTTGGSRRRQAGHDPQVPLVPQWDLVPSRQRILHGLMDIGQFVLIYM